MAKRRHLTDDPVILEQEQDDLIRSFQPSGLGFGKDGMPNAQRVVLLLYLLQRDHGLIALWYLLLKLGTPRKELEEWEARPWWYKILLWWKKPRLILPTESLRHLAGQLSRFSEKDLRKFEEDMASIADYLLSGKWQEGIDPIDLDEDTYLEIRIPNTFKSEKPVVAENAEPKPERFYVLHASRRGPDNDMEGEGAVPAQTQQPAQASVATEDTVQIEDAESSKTDTASASDDDSDSDENVVPIVKSAE